MRFRLVLILTISDEIVGLLVMVQQPWSVGSVGCCETSTESLISCWLPNHLSLSGCYKQLDAEEFSGSESCQSDTIKYSDLDLILFLDSSKQDSYCDNMDPHHGDSVRN